MVKKLADAVNRILSNLDKIAIIDIVLLAILALLDRYKVLHRDNFPLNICVNIGIFVILIWGIWNFFLGRRLVTIWPLKVKKK